jgi:peptidoglycan glycosyltransferase
MGNRVGAAVAIDPKTGEILAMVSNPTYNANAIDEQGEALRADPNNPLLNRATQGLYPPGSTFKTVTAAAALETGAWTTDKRFTCRNAIFIEGFRVACANVPQGEGTYDFGYGYVHSINALFAQVGVDIGWGTLREYSARFGIGADLGTEIDESPSLVGNGTSKAALGSTAFGQGELLTTPLQMALVAAAVANKGEVPQPHLVLRVLDPKERPVLEKNPHNRGRAMNERTAATLRDLMVRNVAEAAGAPAAIPGIQVAGKTGTAETGRPDEPPHAWFIGFAPANDPKIAVAVIIEHAGFGGSVAAPIAGRIMRAALGG